MNHYILVVDIGTQSLRASIIDAKGNTLCFSKQKYSEPFFSPKKGYAEQNVDYYMDRLCDATNEIDKENHNIMSMVEGMVMVTFRDSSVILDENMKPIRPSILWLDQRVTRNDKMDYLKGYEKALFTLIGMKDTVKYNAERTPSYWLKENEKENWAKMKYYVPVGAYFNYVVTGKLVASTADCAGHYPFDFKNGRWFSKMHPKSDVFSIPREALPELVNVGSLIGYVTEDFAKRSSVPVDIPLVASGSDKACETLGNGCIENDMASISLGTACTIDIVNHKYKEPETFLPSYQAPYQGAYDLEVQIYRGLWMIRWFLENFGENDLAESERQGIPVEEYLNRKIAEIPAGSDGLVLQPYWGPGLKRPNAKGSIVGFSGVHTRFHLYRAIYEGIGFALREGMESIIKRTHKKPKYIVLSGGGSKSVVFCHIIADIFNIPCYRSTTTESSSKGAAISGFLYLKVFDSPEDAIKKMVKSGEAVLPNPRNNEVYDALYKKVYRKMYPSLKNVYDSCKNFYLDFQDLG